MKKLLLLSALILVQYGTLFSQANSRTVRGTVVDIFNGAPLVGATVYLVGSNPIIGTTTNENGEFLLKNIPLGRNSFICNYLGFNEQTISNVLVMAGKETNLTFRLEEKLVNLKDVVVKATTAKEKPRNEAALVSARSFSVEETERFAGSLGDPARLVANYAGVMAGNDSRNDIIIRGNSPMGLLWRLEGVDVPNPNHFAAQGTTGGPVSMLNNNLLLNSDFMTGAFPAEYGNALSGVFDLNLRSGNKNKYEFTGQIGFNGFEVAAEGPIKLGKFIPNGSFIADYRYSTLQLVSKMGMDIGTGTAIPEYHDLTLLVDLPTSKIGRFKVIGLFGNSFIRLGRSFDKNEISSHNQLGFATDFGAGLSVAAVTHTLMLNEDTRIKTTFSYQNSTSKTVNDTVDYTQKSYFNLFAGKLDESKLSFSSQFRHRLNAKNNFTVGVTANRYITSYNDSIWMKKYQKRIIITDVNSEASVLLEGYTNWQHRLSEQLTFNGGLHYQYYNLNNEGSLEPRAAIQWRMKGNQSLSFGYGLHSQLQPRTTYFYKGYNDATGEYTENNKKLKFTKSHHFVVGYDWNLSKDFRIKAETYYQQIFNAPVSNKHPEFSMLNNGSGYYIPTLDSLENRGKGRNYGVEFTFEKFLSKGYYALLTVSLFDSKYQGYDGVWRNTAFNTNYAVNLLGGYEWKVGKSNYITMDARSSLSGGKPKTPIDLAASIAAGEETYDLSKVFSERYKSYFRTDLRIGYKMNIGKVTQEWALDLQNITNHENVFSEQYNSTTQEIATIYQQGFLPMMLYRINF